MHISVSVLIIGLTTGLTYAILAVGLVVIYKSARFINFAHGQLGALSAMLLAKAVNDHGVPYWVAFVGALALAAGIGALVDLVVIRKLFDAPRLVLMVATIGVAQVLFAVMFWHPLRADAATLVQKGYPTPIHWTVTIGDQVLSGGEFMILICVPVAAALIAFLFRKTLTGLRIQAVAANSEAARLSGISTRRVSTTVWVLAGVLSALTAILLGPSRGSVLTETLGPGLMTRALAAALVGSMTNLPVAFAAGIGLGVVEQVVFSNFAQGGTTELVVFALMMAVLLWRASSLARVSRRVEEGLPFSTRAAPLPDDLRGAAIVATLRRTTVGLAVLFAVLLPLLPGFRTNGKAFVLTEVIVYALLGLSLLVVAGWSGQLSLGHFAFVGVGAYTASRLSASGHTLPFVVLVGGLIGAAAAVVVGLPALRVRGVFLGVSTLAFAVVSPGWLFQQSWVNGRGSSAVSVSTARLPFGVEITTPRALYYVGLVLLVLVAAALHALRRSGVGRRLVAVRDNPRAAAANGVPPAGTNLVGFALSGFIAAAAGVYWAYANVNFENTSFSPSLSLALLSMVVIGGLGSATGAILGAIAVFGIPTLFDLSSQFIFLTSGVFLLVTLLTTPGGIMSKVYVARDALARAIDRSLRTMRPIADGEHHGPALVCDELTKRFGGVTALDAVSLTVSHGEIVGLIGENGAGKTTLMDCVSGYLQPEGGRVLVNGRDVSRLPPEYRAYCEVGRSFQDARLFPGLTVFETVMLALDRSDRSGLLSSLVHAPWERWSEHRHERAAQDVLELVGMWQHRSELVGDLPTGLRRTCDLATVIVQRPRLVLLDEPTAGIPQADVEAFAPLIHRVREELGCAMLIIEHDMGLVMNLADRIYCLEAGRVIAEGAPADVASHPAVIASYLGTESATIERSLRADGLSRSSAKTNGQKRGRQPATGGRLVAKKASR